MHPAAPGLESFLDEVRNAGVPTRRLPPLDGGQRGSAATVALVWALRHHRPTILHAHLHWPLACHHALVAATAARVPAICATDHSFVDVPWPLSRTLRRLVNRLVDRHVAVSAAAAARLSSAYGVPRSHIDVVHNGVELERFARPQDEFLRATLTGGRDRPVILSVGRLDRQKGHGDLVRAAAALPGVVVALAGEGPEAERLRRLADGLGVGDRIVFLGPRADVPQLMSAADVVVQPSAGFEAFGLVAVEGMAACRPVVVTAVGGPQEVVIDGLTGLVVPPGRPDALARALAGLLASDGERQRLGRAGLEWAHRRFDVRTTAARLTALYESLARDARRRG
jgi:glycosyltransferase involved in cell wall biosynthesis